MKKDRADLLERLEKQEYRLAEAVVRAAERDGMIPKVNHEETPPTGSTEELPPGAEMTGREVL